MKTLLFFILFFAISALFIITNNNLALSKQENIDIFYKMYLDWANQIYQNSQILTGEAVKLQWLPK
jgi:hypothetical protein